MTVVIIWIAAVTCSTYAYWRYYKDTTQKGGTEPNRWSWLIWSASTMMEALTYEAVSADFLKGGIFFISGCLCFLVTVFIWAKSKWEKPTASEIACVLVSILALVVWLYFEQTLFGHLLMVAALPIAFFPTWKDAWQNPSTENSPAWGLWAIGDLLTMAFVLLRLNNWEEVPYAAIEFVCHALVWSIVAFRQKAAAN